MLMIGLLTGSSIAGWDAHQIYAGIAGDCDGQKLVDVNGDGLEDVVSSHDTFDEPQGGSSIHVHPGYANVKSNWPYVHCTAGGPVEGAGMADLDGDGACDMISVAQAFVGVVVHWAPTRKEDYLDASKWTSERIPDSKNGYDVIIAQLDGKNGPDVMGATSGSPYWYECPAEPRVMSVWKSHVLHPDVGRSYMRTFLFEDMNDDGYKDVVLTNVDSGNVWLENPGPGPAVYEAWVKHPIYKGNGNMCFGWVADIDGDGIKDYISTSGKEPYLVFVKRLHKVENQWKAYPVSPSPFAGKSSEGIKGATVGDYNQNGIADVLLSAGRGQGIRAIEFKGDPAKSDYTMEIIADKNGKGDYPEYYDIDGDGDDDIVLCFETDNGAIMFYENPLRSPSTVVVRHSVRPVVAGRASPPYGALFLPVRHQGIFLRKAIAVNGRTLTPRRSRFIPPGTPLLPGGIYLSDGTVAAE
jgi:hypothetical protein